MTNPKRADHLAWRKLGEHTIVIDSRINQEIHHFNEVGAFIWEHCVGEYTLEEIAQLVSNIYDVDNSRALKDIQEFVLMLKGKKLLER